MTGPATLPSIGDPYPTSPETKSKPSPAAKKKTVESKQPTAKTIQLKFTLLDIREGYRTRRVDMQKLSENQQNAMYCLFHAAQKSGAKLANGTPITKPVHVIKKLLEDVHRAAQRNR